MNGNTIPHYGIIDKLGQRGMGKVFFAEDSTLGCRAVMKMLPDVFVDDPERLTGLEREARLSASLNHPNIASIHDLKQSDVFKSSAVDLNAPCPACHEKHLIRFRPPCAPRITHSMKLESQCDDAYSSEWILNGLVRKTYPLRHSDDSIAPRRLDPFRSHKRDDLPDRRTYEIVGVGIFSNVWIRYKMV